MVSRLFHISKHRNEAVDQAGREEQATLKANGDHRRTKTRYHWLRNEENLSKQAREVFKDLKACGLKVGSVWALKALYRDLWGYRSAGRAKRFFDALCSRAIRSRPEPIKKVARMTKRHLDNIMTWFKHRISMFFYCGKLDIDPAVSQ